jgi:hypothetical protein
MIVDLSDAYYQCNTAIYTKDYHILIFYPRIVESFGQFLHSITFLFNLLFQALVLISLLLCQAHILQQCRLHSFSINFKFVHSFFYFHPQV